MISRVDAYRDPSPAIRGRLSVRQVMGRSHPRPLAWLLLVASLLTISAGAVWAADYYVDAGSGSCSNSGPGTEANPYCTISAAVAAHSGPGVVIWVKPGTYRERVTVPASGASGNRFVIRALGAPVIVDGADDFSNAGQWTLLSGNVWLASSVTWSPVQVFADGARLTPSTGSPGSLPTNSFRYVSGAGLYVNAGGGNPGSHQTKVGRRANAFVLSGRSWVTLDGFTATRTEDRAFSITNSSNNVTVTHNTVTFAGRAGIYFSTGTGELIEANVCSDNGDHGIHLASGVTGSTIRANECFRNAHPTVRSANGIYVYSSPSNVIERNRLYDNQDTGLQLNRDSNNCVCTQNTSWNNGDHGYDHTNTIGVTHIGDVAYGNYRDGFSMEASASGIKLYDCVGVNNGITTGGFNLWVDSNSTPGFLSDYNIFWNSTSQNPIKYISTQYSTVAAFSAATGKDVHSTQANPLFINPAAGDFHLGGGSPAIDAGTSAPPNWPTTDADGNVRLDVSTVPNTGAGPIPYTDRGAFEFQISGLPPIAQLTVNPGNGRAPLAVTADASGSTDPNGGGIVSYRFDFGDGTIVGPQAGATAAHSFAAGTWTVTVTVVSVGGFSASTSQQVLVNRPPVAILSLTPTYGPVPLDVIADASGSSDPEGGTLSYGFDFGDGTVVGPQSAPTAAHTYSTTGSFTVTVTVTDNVGDTGSATRNAVADIAPDGVIDLPGSPSITLTAGQAENFQGTGSDPDGHLPLTFLWDFGGGAANSTNEDAGMVTFGTAGIFTVRYIVTDALGLSDPTPGSLTVTVEPDPTAGPNLPPVAALSVTPATGNAPLVVNANASGSSDPDGIVVSYRFDFGEGTIVGPQPTATASHTYAAGTWTATVLVTDDRGETATATASVIVAPVGPGANLVGNPSFETATTGWNSYSGGTLLRVPGGFVGAWSLQLTGPATTGNYGVNDSPNWIANAGPAGSTYRFSAWVRSATNTGLSKLQVREYLGTTKIGVNTYSTGVPLSPIWKRVTLDFTTGASGSTLDYQVINYPLVTNEVFMTDNVSIYNLGAIPSNVLAGGPLNMGTRAALGRVVSIPGNGSLNLGTSAQSWSVRLEFPSDAAVLGGAGTPPEVELESDLGEDRIRGSAVMVGDLDGNGVPELEATFQMADLGALLATLPAGTRRVPLHLALFAPDGEAGEAELTLEVVSSAAPLRAAIAPNPMRSDGVLSFVTHQTGPVLVQLFDITGREVGRPLDEAQAASGLHQISLRDGVTPLPSGLYFYRIHAPEATATGRFLFIR